MTPGKPGLLIMPMALLIMLLVGCSPGPSDPPPPGPGTAPASSSAATPPASAGPASAGIPEATEPVSLPPEPTTTNTLPPPPEPTAPAPTTAGNLTAADLPVPDGWQKVVAEGGAEQGYQGNGTWLRGRDPRYAAQDVITVGCAPITRDDYPDPTAALEGSYGHKGDPDGRPGIGLVLQFSSDGDARSYFDSYRDQVGACAGGGGPVEVDLVDSTVAAGRSLIDRRSYPGEADWTEVAARSGDRITLIILTDPGHRMSIGDTERLLQRIS